VVLDPSFEASIEALGSRCARAEDAARFLVGLELAMADAPERGPAARAFCDAYARGAVPLAPAALQAFAVKYRAQALVDRWPAARAAGDRLGTVGWLLRPLT
jgi:hypothetical protein